MATHINLYAQDDKAILVNLHDGAPLGRYPRRRTRPKQRGGRPSGNPTAELGFEQLVLLLQAYGGNRSAIRSDGGKASNEHAPFLAPRCARAATRRSDSVGRRSIANRSTWRRLIRGLPRSARGRRSGT